MANIVLLSTGQPVTNPRLVKEADALAGQGHHVTAYCSWWAKWAMPLDKQLLQTRHWHCEYAGGLPGQVRYRWTRWRYGLAKRLVAATGMGSATLIANATLSRTTPELIAAARHHPADLYIGHNLGALPAVIAGASQHGGRAVFDLEDWYTGMGETGVSAFPWQRQLNEVEEKYIPACDCLLAASEGIAAVYRKKYDLPVHTLLNTFPADWAADEAAENSRGPLQLFWFSQTIGAGRGLEDVVAAMARMKPGSIELHLLGDWQPGYQTTLFGHAKTHGLDTSVLHAYPPCYPEDIPRFAAQFDVGLALEPGVSWNNSVALSNKIFTYFLAGNAIVATATPGQQQFLEPLPQTGFVYKPGDIETLQQGLQKLGTDRQYLMQLRRQSLELGRTRYNWDIESKELLTCVSALLEKPASYDTV
ncbi:MAG: hypothetical protein LJE74_10915 [Proteobacteria bacterium]|jgi:glycosyltransferase involved in cell wall biosynthesis|nr:hypothetical protein [Pseudomonadota bacterium]